MSDKIRNFKKIQEKIDGLRLDALLVTSLKNIKYLTGYTSLDGVLLITKSDVFFSTSFCESGEAKANLSSIKVIERKRNQWNFFKNFTKEKKIKRLGFEKEHISFAKLKELQKRLVNCRLKGTIGLIEELRAVKTKEEIAKIKKAIATAERIFTQLKQILAPGLSELDIFQDLNIQIAKEGGQPAFSPIVAFGSHTAFPHAQPGRKSLKKNDLILIDMGVEVEGYNSDLTRTFILGNFNSRQEKIYNLLIEIQEYLSGLIKPGISVAKVEKNARQFLAKKGWDNFPPHNIGHGIGLEVHEKPFFSVKNNARLIPGMVFTLEPALYFPNWGGMRIEDIYLITQRDCQKLSQLSIPPLIR